MAPTLLLEIIEGIEEIMNARSLFLPKSRHIRLNGLNRVDQKDVYATGPIGSAI